MKEQPAMKMPSRKTPRPRYIICPFCESGELVSVGPGFARCRSCGLPLLGSALETLLDVIGLPDASGVHACDCGHPEMRRLPDGVFHCPACGSEVLPVEVTPDPEGRASGRVRRGAEGQHPPGRPHASIRSEE